MMVPATVLAAVSQPNVLASPAVAFVNTPLYFIQNQGQMDPRVKFYEAGFSHASYFSVDGIYQVVKLRDSVHNVSRRVRVKLNILDGNPDAVLIPEAPLQTRLNYFSGNKNKVARRDVPTYSALRYESVYPGIDIRFHGDQQALEYDIHVAPGSDPGQVRMAYQGILGLSIDADGALLIEVDGGQIQQRPPYLYQDIKGQHVAVEGRYRLIQQAGTDIPAYGFDVARYDRDFPLVIDPIIVTSSYLGGGEDDAAHGIASDAAGNVYLTGRTWSTDFPTLMSIKTVAQPEYQDAFVSKFDATGALVFSTYLGGSNMDSGASIAVDSAGNSYITGVTQSADFPVTAQAYQTRSDGAFEDAFISKLGPTGNLLYSSFLGGTLDDEGNSIVVDETGTGVTIVLTGETWSHDFPAVNPLFTVMDTGNNRDAFITKMDLNLNGAASMLWSTYLGGSNRDAGTGVDIDNAGNVYIVGTTESSDMPVTANGYPNPFVLGFSRVFMARISAAGNILQYIACLGGNGESIGHALAVDGNGNAYLTGSTHTTNFPMKNPIYTVLDTGDNTDAFIAKIDTNGSGMASLIYSTLLGGSGNDEGHDIVIDLAGNAYVTGFTRSVNFPMIAAPAAPMNALQGDEDGFVVKIDPLGSSVLYSVYLGGTDEDYIHAMALDSSGDILLAGETRSIDLPLLNAYQSILPMGNRSAFMARIR